MIMQDFAHLHMPCWMLVGPEDETGDISHLGDIGLLNERVRQRCAVGLETICIGHVPLARAHRRVHVETWNAVQVKAERIEQD
jgi:hypothetical protein